MTRYGQRIRVARDGTPLHAHMLVSRGMRSDELAVLTKERLNMSDYTILPDGSAFGVMSFPLPQDHWLYAPPCQAWDEKRDTAADTPHPILTHEQRDAVIAAVRYAIRGATMCGKEQDFDPDALVQNAVYALCGPYARTVTAS